jgi:hypothetical protein
MARLVVAPTTLYPKDWFNCELPHTPLFEAAVTYG